MSWRYSGMLLFALIACGDSQQVDFDMGDDDTLFAGREATLAEGDEFAMLTENGAVKLGLTRERLYFQLSDAVREHVDSAMAVEFDSSDSRLGRAIGRAVRRGVTSAMRFDIDFDLDEIRDVEYRDGELVFDFVEGGDPLDNMNVDDEPITRSFSEEDARAFVAAFRRVKGMGPAAADTGTADAPAGADTAGGASF